MTSIRQWLMKCPLQVELPIRLVCKWPDRFLSQLKYYGEWYDSFSAKGMFQEQPWLPFECIEWLDHYLDMEMKVFEWGTGGSTVFFAKRVEQVWSIEHDSDWYNRVNNELNNRGMNNVELMLEPPEDSKESTVEYGSEKKPYRDASFRSYVKSIDRSDESLFDLVLVDGRCRMGCLKEAKSHVASGGCIVLDDAQRSRYQQARSIMETWSVERVFDGLKPATRGRAQTVLYRKSSS
ncbi:MAG: hypothetical protein ABEJ65_01635 [bacterium]